jgi:type IV pilus assembly protein PilM
MNLKLDFKLGHGFLDQFKKHKLGVDIGKRSLKGVRLKTKNGRVYLDKYFFHDLAETSSKYPESAATEEVLRAAVELERLEKSETATSIKDSQIFSHQFKLPLLKDKEMKEAVAHEISENNPIPIEELNFDYLVSPDESDLSGNCTVRAYSTRKEWVTERMKILQAAKLSPASVESDLLAITAMLDFNDYLTKDGVYAVFDLGETHLTGGLIIDRELRFTHTFEYSLGAINRALQERLYIDYSKAEQIKLSYDFNSEGETPAQDSFQIVEDALTRIFQQIMDTLKIFQEASDRSARIDEILLVGGGSRLKDISKVTEKFFKIKTTAVNPFRNIEIYSNTKDSHDSEGEDLAKIAPYMSTAVGLALADIQPSRKGNA